jgi:hypothetical protein
MAARPILELFHEYHWSLGTFDAYPDMRVHSFDDLVPA